MQLLGNLFEYALDRRGETLNIFGATSGDTGSAGHTRCAASTASRVHAQSPRPHEPVSSRHRCSACRTPTSTTSRSRACSTTARTSSRPSPTTSPSSAMAHRDGQLDQLGAPARAGRVLLAGYFQATSNDEKVFACPSGNFGNICAGHVARMMGLPIRLIVSRRMNDVLDEFFRTGGYRPRGAAETNETSSPSMDISKASNFERFIADLLGRNGDAVIFASAPATDARPKSAPRLPTSGFTSGCSTHADRVATIQRCHAEFGVIIDLHTGRWFEGGAWFRAALAKR